MAGDQEWGSTDHLGLTELRKRPRPTCKAKARMPCTHEGRPMLSSVHGARCE